jgi:hypothetical protein
METLTPTAPVTQSKTKLEKHIHKAVEQGPVEIEKRLDTLSNKWTVGRITKVLTGVVILLGVILGNLVSPWWQILTVLGGVFLLQYIFVSTSPFELLLKQAGLRTGSEITQEKVALKTLRGDFQAIPTIHQIEDRDATSRLEGEGGMVIDDDERKIDVKDAIPQVAQASSITAVNR